jgi:hypothetical protein
MPDVQVHAWDALDVAHEAALEALLEREGETAGDPGSGVAGEPGTDPDPEAEEIRRFRLEWALVGLRAKMNSVTVDIGALRHFVGDFGPRSVSLENSVLFYQRQGRAKYALVPLGTDLFQPQVRDDFRIQFVRDDSGEVT